MAALPHWEGLYPEAESHRSPILLYVVSVKCLVTVTRKNVVNNTEGRKEGKETGREG